MSKVAWFCYELGLRGWSPCVYHDRKPSTGPNTRDVNRTPLIDVPNDCIDDDSNVSFGELQKRFPPPTMEQSQ